MGIKVTAPNSGSDYVEFQNAAGTSLAKVGGYDDGSSNGHLEIYTTASGTSAERMRIDSSGNVGIGATPLTSIAGYKSLDIGAVGNGFLSSTNDHYVTSNAYYNGGWKYATSYPVSYYQQTDGQHIWKAAGSGTSGAAITWIERMRIDSSGNLLVGNTATPAVGNIGFAFQPSGLMYVTANGDSAVRIKRGSDTGAALRWYGPNSNTEVGNVAVSTTTTTYNTSSDYRLKENIQPMQDALDVVAQLNPVTYTWKADGSDGQGFIAHELQAVVPDCVTGEKDAVDEEGKPVYQGIDTSFLVATLTKAIQELKAEVDDLKAQLKGAA